MITESITRATGTCSRCQRADVPCLELGCSERDEGHRSVYSIRLELRVVVCVACLDAARVKRDVRRTRFDAPPDVTELAPGITSTPGVCGGEPCIAGTRWRTSTAREYHYDSLRILRDYPSLTVAQVDAAREGVELDAGGAGGKTGARHRDMALEHAGEAVLVFS